MSVTLHAENTNPESALFNVFFVFPIQDFLFHRTIPVLYREDTYQSGASVSFDDPTLYFSYRDFPKKLKPIPSPEKNILDPISFDMGFGDQSGTFIVDPGVWFILFQTFKHRM